MTLEFCIGGVLLIIWAVIFYFFFVFLAGEKTKSRTRKEEFALFSYKKANEEYAKWMAKNEARLAWQLTKAADKLGYDCLHAELFGKNLANKIIDELANELANREAEDKMTNFDRWKEELTPETFVSGNYADFIDIRDYCEKCPAKNVCPKGGKDTTCAKEFLRWANEKAEVGMDHEALAKKSIERFDKMKDEPKTEESRRC